MLASEEVGLRQAAGGRAIPASRHKARGSSQEEEEKLEEQSGAEPAPGGPASRRAFIQQARGSGSREAGGKEENEATLTVLTGNVCLHLG